MSQYPKTIFVDDKKVVQNKPFFVYLDQERYTERFIIHPAKQESPLNHPKSRSTIQTSLELQMKLEEIDAKDWKQGMYRIASTTSIFESLMSSQQFTCVSFIQQQAQRKTIFRNQFCEPDFGNIEGK